MKATKAYIASIGTTGVLLGASILMLAVVSAVVAFDRWPDGNVSTRVQTLALNEKPAPIRVSARPVSAAVAARTAIGAPRTAAPTTGARRVAVNRQGVAGERFTGGSPTGGGGSPAGPVKVPAVPSDPLQPVQDGGEQILGAISNPGSTAGAVADGTQAVTDAAGVGVGQVSPSLGGAVAGTGQTAAQVVRELPLPQHVLPGH